MYKLITYNIVFYFHEIIILITLYFLLETQSSSEQQCEGSIVKENVADCSLQSDLSMHGLMNSTFVSNENTGSDNVVHCNLSYSGHSLCENGFTEEDNNLSINGQSLSDNGFSEEDNSNFLNLEIQLVVH